MQNTTPSNFRLTPATPEEAALIGDVCARIGAEYFGLPVEQVRETIDRRAGHGEHAERVGEAVYPVHLSTCDRLLIVTALEEYRRGRRFAVVYGASPDF